MMADISLVLLIGLFLTNDFFANDKGIRARLAPYNLDTLIRVPVPARQILHLEIDENGIMVENEYTYPEGLREAIKSWYYRGQYLSPDKTYYIMINVSRSASYEDYLTAIDGVRSAHHKLKENLALKYFKQPYADLPLEDRRAIVKRIRVEVVEQQETITPEGELTLPLWFAN